MTNGCEFDKPEVYQVRVKGGLDREWSEWFDGFTVTPQASGETLLTGVVADQAALHGLLNKIRDLGLPLLSIKRAESEALEEKKPYYYSMKEKKMNKLQIKELMIILALGLVGWALCGAIMWIGMAVTSMENTLIIHAIGAPIIFGVIASIYFRAFNYTTPLQTAIAFVSVVVFMDIFVVALLIEKSFEMFASLLGTWIPWALIFASTYLTGLLGGQLRHKSLSENVSLGE
jgi:hypothetical protein